MRLCTDLGQESWIIQCSDSDRCTRYLWLFVIFYLGGSLTLYQYMIVTFLEVLVVAHSGKTQLFDSRTGDVQGSMCD